MKLMSNLRSADEQESSQRRSAMVLRTSSARMLTLLKSGEALVSSLQIFLMVILRSTTASKGMQTLTNRLSNCFLIFTKSIMIFSIKGFWVEAHARFLALHGCVDQTVSLPRVQTALYSSKGTRRLALSMMTVSPFSSSSSTLSLFTLVRVPTLVVLPLRYLNGMLRCLSVLLILSRSRSSAMARFLNSAAQTASCARPNSQLLRSLTRPSMTLTLVDTKSSSLNFFIAFCFCVVSFVCYPSPVTPQAQCTTLDLCDVGLIEQF